MADFDQKKFVKEVRAFMRKNDLSVRAFAKLSGTTLATLYRLDKGDNTTLRTIQKIKNAMKDYKDLV